MEPEPPRDTDWLAEAFGSLAPSSASSTSRLERQVRFLLELDKAKSVLRRSYITDGSRLENDAEHMWHVTLAALVLAEHAAEPVDALRLACMLAVHDIVEIDAGDTFIYDTVGRADKLERETRAAERLFGMLPDDQAAELRALWDEFEARETPTAKMAAALDRLLPVLMNRATGGRSWAEHGIVAGQVFELNSQIKQGSPALWDFARRLLEAAERDGVLASGAAAQDSSVRGGGAAGS